MQLKHPIKSILSTVHLGKQPVILADELKQILNRRRKRYAAEAIIVASVIYSQSPISYNILRGFFILPHKRYLQSLLSSLNVSAVKGRNNNHYLSYMQNIITPQTK